MIRIVMNALCRIPVLLLISGCHMFDDAEDVDPCRLNSGYPCPCSVSQTLGTCDDGSHCISDSDDFGFCAWPCAITDPTICFDRQGFGAEGLCGLEADGRTYCVLVCDLGVDDAACPPGMACVAYPTATHGVCEPAPAF